MKTRDKYSKLLREEFKYKVELHAHTSPASKCGDFPPYDVIKKYSDLDFDAIAITNHFLGGHEDMSKDEFLKFYLNDYHQAVEAGDKLGIKVYLGAELRFTNQNDNDYLLYGIDESDLEKIYDCMDSTLENFVENLKTDKMVLIQAHPFRDGMKRANTDLLDGIEGFNIHPHHNSRVGTATRYAAEVNKPITAGTDFHHNTHQGLGATRFTTLPKDSFELAEELKKDEYIMEIAERILLP